MTEKEKIVILGFGWVGQANALALIRLGYTVFYYDVVSPPRHYPKYSGIYEKIKPIGAPLQEEGPTTWYIVCVGDRVLEGGTQDTSLIKNTLDSVRSAKGRIVLRSTVLPDLLKELEFDFYLPEFLHEKKAVEECLNPFYFVVGKYGQKGKSEEPLFFLDWRNRAYKVFEGTPEQASYIKYLSNLWNALRIAFANEFGDIVASHGGDIKEAEKILDFVFEGKDYLKYGKSFGGHCLPKDSLSFSSRYLGKENAAILKAMVISNLAHKEIEERQGNLPEWFSFWEYSQGKLVNPRWPLILWRKINAIPAVRFTRRKIGPVANLAFNKIVGAKSLERSRKTWNKLAAKNARYFVNIGTKSGEKVDEFELRETGESDYKKYVLDDELLKQRLGNVQESTALEIGCGIGRMAEFFARDFKRIYGIDISDAMIDYAKKRLFAINNAMFAVNNGKIIPFSDSTFDFIFSLSVFKHIPSTKAVRGYFSEIYRTLKPGGIAKIDLRRGPKVSRWLWSYGATFEPDSIRIIAQVAGLKFLKYEIGGPKRFWVWVEKSGQGT